jgi:hypothetical protein
MFGFLFRASAFCDVHLSFLSNLTQSKNHLCAQTQLQNAMSSRQIGHILGSAKVRVALQHEMLAVGIKQSEGASDMSRRLRRLPSPDGRP